MSSNFTVSPVRRDPISSWDFLKGERDLPAMGEHILLASSMQAVFLDFVPREQLAREVVIQHPPLVFSFQLSGRGAGHLLHPLNRRETITSEPGTSLLSFTPESRCRVEIPEQQRYRNLHVYLSPERLATELGEELDRAPRELRGIFEGTRKKAFHLSGSLSPHVRVILDQIYNCPYGGGFRKLHLDYKCMELIVRRIYEVFEAPSGKRMAKITTSDRERIHEARDILTGNLENPPTLTELSRRVGINTTKLKRGFRQIYGISPYALLRRERLRLACRLLGDKHPNITEISHHLGYCDTSHFIREFSKQYGTSPGRYAKTLSP